MRKLKSMYLFLVLIGICLMVVVANRLAQAGPPLKADNPGVPGLLAEIDQLEQTVAHQKAIIQELLNAMQNYAPVPQTGQATPYSPGDDGDLKKGVPWPGPRFTDNGDGTVTDNLTNLMWTKDTRPFIWATKEWSDAVSACNDLSLAGHVDWRLPNVKELHSLVAYGNTDPGSTLPAGHPFVNLVANHYWSSTTDPSYSNGAYTVHFGNGTVTEWYKTPPSLISGNIWCVRGGN